MAITSVGFIGLGIMGRPMAHNLLRAGFRLAVWNRSRPAVDELVAAGASAADSPADAARRSQLTITMLPDSPDVEAVALGPDGVLAGAAPGSFYVDMSTVAPSVARRVAEAGRARGVGCLDAPVSGSDQGAREGTLSIMVGGEPGDLDAVRPVLEALGRRIVHCGPSGMGQTVKLCNQVAGAGTLMAVCEALLLAAKAGADVGKVIEALSGGAARSWMLENLAPRIAGRDFAPGFMVRLMQKDLRLVQGLAAECGAPLAGAGLAQALLRAVEAHGGGDHGIQAMATALERLANTEIRA
ncbi:MAG TPA: NAD(P)-dependent oxidoreductase [Chloroflexota bacterium]|jgi:3-hydroxyisobutyrate dehydrogenase|nr:NAD(P)-dependent oxidoreductase [Chloroflexota bacterium]